MDYEGPLVAPKILAMLDEALQVEENIDIDASRVKGSARVPGKARYELSKFHFKKLNLPSLNISSNVSG